MELTNDGNRVSGVVADVNGRPQAISAKRGVVLAAGDYAGAADLIARFKGERFAGIEGVNPRATGDGHRLAEQAGAKLVNMDVTYGPELRFVPPASKTLQQLLPASGPVAWLVGRLVPLLPCWLLDALVRRVLVTWQHPENALFADGAILVNAEGRRFCNEQASPEREIALAAQPGKVGYILLDERLIERYSTWPHFISTAPQIAYAYVQDYLRLRPDIAVQSSSLAEVARRRGLPAEALEATVTDCNAQRTGCPPLAGPPWVLLGPAKAYFTTTEGSAAINERFEVLDHDGRRIPGLYAVGQNGLGGQILWGHGLHIAWAMTSGRLVGKQLAAESRA
jgi:fumarate reductase flavoprotein subunit